ncbi:MAG TPA: serine/threonine protein kinase [Acidimicrobiia bacterium]|nr:serine/threonine protein kinase [Acidimicrobiia bacterium]
MIKIGTNLNLPASNRHVVVTRTLGEGSQGVVFEANDASGPPLAIKWYYPHTATESQRRAIALLIDRGTPSNRFLWPMELLTERSVPGFGYAMPLRPADYASLSDLLVGRADMPFRAVCRLCLELAHSFLLLHAQGLCYRDISFSNVFFDQVDGTPLICDNDNVGVDGASPIAVLGTRRFMAPEIVRHEALPSTQTDLYSLSVLLFYVLMMGHPLLGKRELEFECWDDNAESIVFGKDAHFIFDPEDDSNRPIPEIHASVIRYWSLYPDFVKQHFVHAFTRGLTDPKNGRVRESVWRVALARLHDCIVECTSCNRQNFVSIDTPNTCWACGDTLRSVGRCQINGAEIVLGKGARITGHHVRRNYDYETVIGKVVAHPSRPDLLGMQNCTESAWEAHLPSGETHAVEPGRSIRLSSGLELDLGAVRAHVE